VVEEADRLKVTLLDKREFAAQVVGRDPDTDIAVIKIDGSGLRPVSFGNSDSLRIGEWVLAVGNPLEFAFTVTAGIVSAKGRGLDGLQNDQLYRIQDFIQTDAAINPGNSGGPLVNVYGQVVGINSAIASPTGFFQGYGFAIPVNLARIVAEQLIAHGKVTRAILGVSIRDADPEDAAYVGLQAIRGVLITAYSGENSPAKAAGIQPGDVIVEVDGQPVEYGAQLQRLIGFKRPGQEVKITLVRKGGERRTVSVRLTARQEDTPQVAAAGHDASASRRPYEVKLGVTVEPVAQEVAARAQLDEEHTGLLITRVDPEGPAADKLGPQLIITHVNGQRIRTTQELERALVPVKAGEIVELRLYSIRANQSNLVRLRAGGQD
jgi:serine protease Do